MRCDFIEDLGYFAIGAVPSWIVLSMIDVNIPWWLFLIFLVIEILTGITYLSVVFVGLFICSVCSWIAHGPEWLSYWLTEQTAEEKLGYQEYKEGIPCEDNSFDKDTKSWGEWKTGWKRGYNEKVNNE